jgi:peroxiredoxin
MKRYLLFLVLAVHFFGCEQKPKSDEHAVAAANEPSKVVEKDERPVMQINLSDGRQIEPKTLNKPSILIFFQPDCDHCQHEAQDIEKRLSEFSAYEIYFISSHPMEVIQQFAKDYKLEDKPNVFFGSTSVESVLNNYGAISAPSIYVYTAEGKLKKSFNGQTDVQQIIQML